MKVILRRINKTPLDFEVKSDAITFKGYLQYHSGKLILLQAKLQGILVRVCDICAQEFQMPVDDEIKFYLCDGVYEDTNNIELDVVESLNDSVDIDELLHSEIELIKSDYCSCKNCKQN